MSKPTKQLTAKQELFVKEYCANGFNATQAALSAGYSSKTAYACGAENLKKPQIKQYIDYYKQERSNKCNITYDWVLEKLQFAIDACMNGSASKDGRVNATALVSAVAELNKMTGFHAPEKKMVAHADVAGRKDRQAMLEQFKNELSEFEREY